MSAGLNLPRVTNLNDWMITNAAIDEMTETDLINEVEEMKVKVMVTEGKVSTVLIAPELYNSFLAAVDELAASRGAAATA